MADDNDYKTACARFQLISPLLDASLDKAELINLRREISLEAGVSEKTIIRYLNMYRTSGLEGLIPSFLGRPGGRSITQKVLAEAISMRETLPSRSVSMIIRTLEQEGTIEENSVKRSTLQERLAKSGCGKRQILSREKCGSKGGRRFQQIDRNAVWQSDSKHGPNIKSRKTYLISYIDDCSRLILHSEWYFSEDTVSVLDSFRKGIVKYGTPGILYLDNGPSFKSNALGRACSILKIRKSHHPPYTPRAKGKIEKFHQVVDKFIDELRLDKADTLDQLNGKWWAFLEMHYQIVPHHAHGDKGLSPTEAFNSNKKELRYVTKEELDLAMLLTAPNRHRVDDSGCVNFRGAKYTGEGLGVHAGRKVAIVWDPSDSNMVWAEVEMLPPIPIKPLEMPRWLPKEKKKPLPAPKSGEGSRVLRAASEALRRREDKRLEAELGPGWREGRAEAETQEAPKAPEAPAGPDDGAEAPAPAVKRQAISFRDVITIGKKD